MSSPDDALGCFILLCLLASISKDDGCLEKAPVPVLLVALQAQLHDYLLLALTHRRVIGTDGEEAVTDSMYTLVEVVTPLVYMHPNPSYRLEALNILKRWMFDFQKVQPMDGFVIMQDLITSAPHLGLQAVMTGFLRELISAQEVDSQFLNESDDRLMLSISFLGWTFPISSAGDRDHLAHVQMARTGRRMLDRGYAKYCAEGDLIGTADHPALLPVEAAVCGRGKHPSTAFAKQGSSHAGRFNSKLESGQRCRLSVRNSSRLSSGLWPMLNLMKMIWKGS